MRRSHFRIGAVLDTSAGIGIGMDQREGSPSVAGYRQMLRMAGEAHQQDVARPRYQQRALP